MMHLSCTQVLTLFIGFLQRDMKGFADDWEYKTGFQTSLKPRWELQAVLNLRP